MGFKLAEAYVEIGGNTKPLDSTLGSVKQKVGALAGMRFNIPGGGFGGLLAGAFAGAEIGKAVLGASDLAETLSKVQATFGGASSKVTSFADEMAARFGLVKGPLMDAVSGIGLIAKGAGLAEPKAADLGTNMAKLAADASSFYNVPMDVALEKIRAGLVGESEPLRAFGVLLSEDAVKAEALRLGLSKGKKELDESTKVMARASLITRGLGTATGDLERTQGGFANQLRQLQGHFTNASVALGERLLPPLNKMLVLFNDIARGGAGKLTDAIARVTSWIPSLGVSFSDVIDTIRLVYENWSDITERTVVMVGGWLTNAEERAIHMRDVFAEAISGTVKTMTDFSRIDKVFFDAIFDHIKSGFKEPVKIKFEALFGDFERVAKLKLTDVTAQLEEIDRRMAKKAGDRAAAEAKKAGVNVSAVNAASGGTGQNETSFYSSGQEFSNALQKAAFNTQVKPTEAEKKQIEIATQQKTELEKATTLLGQIAKKINAAVSPVPLFG